MQTHQKFFAKNCILPFLSKISYCCSHNCIIIDSMFSFQGAKSWIFLKRLNESFHVSIDWFSQSFLVEISGIEPLTSCLQGRRSPSWAKPPYIFFLKWRAKMDSLFAKSHAGFDSPLDCLRNRLRVHFKNSYLRPSLPSFFGLHLVWSGGPKWTRTIDLTIISRVL